MRIRFFAVMLAAFVPAVLLPMSFALSQKAAFNYTGPDTCKMCHKSKDNSGPTWNASKHAKAMESLNSEAAKKFSDNPASDPKCLECHTTGFGKETGYKAGGEAKLAGVSCEVCHGPGSGYKSMMTKVPDMFNNGLIVPSVAVCVTCHNAKSPTFKEFHYQEAAATIRHGKEEDMKVPAAQAAYVGNASCVMCHKNRDTSVSVWEGSAHAGALEALKSDEAKKFSADPLKDPVCLACHTTGLTDNGGYDPAAADDANAKVAGVMCEGCHGPGEKYKKTMSSREDSLKNGMVIPDERTCRKCHNPLSPTYKEFNFEEMVKKIAHGKK